MWYNKVAAEVSLCGSIIFMSHWDTEAMAYDSKPMGNRLGIYAPEIEEQRHQRGLDERGFPVPREEGAEADDKTDSH